MLSLNLNLQYLRFFMLILIVNKQFVFPGVKTLSKYYSNIHVICFVILSYPKFFSTLIFVFLFLIVFLFLF